MADGHKIRATNMWASGRHKARIPIGDMGVGITMFPFLQILPQEKHEKILEETLEGLGVRVEREKELVEFEDVEGGVRARFKDLNGGEEETCEAAFIVGCDGAHSTVRRVCDIGFEGETYSQLFFVADVEGSGNVLNGEAHINISDVDMAILFPYDQDHKARVSGAVDEAKLGKAFSKVTFDDVAPSIMKAMDMKVNKVNWFTTYRVHHRVAESFRKGRAFLVGDAAHIHSPVGGQGMNTGIGDAVNVAWKLAAVLLGRANPSLLDTYEVERRAFAKTLVQTTDATFNGVVAEGFFAHIVRDWIVPAVVPILARLDVVRRTAFQRMSQVLVNYRHSALSAGTAGSVKGGDRLPWAPVRDLDNYESLKIIGWQVHVYGSAREEMTEWCESKRIPLHVFPWDEKYQKVGLGRDAAYLVRPDTYVAVSEPSGLPQSFDKLLGEYDFRLA